jgi:hypothetical protein
LKIKTKVSGKKNKQITQSTVSFLHNKKHLSSFYEITTPPTNEALLPPILIKQEQIEDSKDGIELE